MEKANAFAAKLAKTFSPDTNNHYDNEHYIKIEEYMNRKSYLPKYLEKSSHPFTRSELERAIKKLNRKTSLDHLDISNIMLKAITEEVKESRRSNRRFHHNRPRH